MSPEFSPLPAFQRFHSIVEAVAYASERAEKRQTAESYRITQTSNRIFRDRMKRK